MNKKLIRKIRKNVFETNSSSCHSVSISQNKTGLSASNYYQTSPDGFLHTTMGEFGWGYDEFYDFGNKLKYALTMVEETEVGRFENSVPQKFYDSVGFHQIEDAVKKKIGCNGILIEPLKGYWTYGYIDHQSCEDYDSLQDFLDDYGVTIEDFLFNEDVVLIIDNDNR